MQLHPPDPSSMERIALSEAPILIQRRSKPEVMSEMLWSFDLKGYVYLIPGYIHIWWLSALVTALSQSSTVNSRIPSENQQGANCV